MIDCGTENLRFDRVGGVGLVDALPVAGNFGERQFQLRTIREEPADAAMMERFDPGCFRLAGFKFARFGSGRFDFDRPRDEFLGDPGHRRSLAGSIEAAGEVDQIAVKAEPGLAHRKIVALEVHHRRADAAVGEAADEFGFVLEFFAPRAQPVVVLQFGTSRQLPPVPEGVDVAVFLAVAIQQRHPVAEVAALQIFIVVALGPDDPFGAHFERKVIVRTALDEVVRAPEITVADRLRAFGEGFQGGRAPGVEFRRQGGRLERRIGLFHRGVAEEVAATSADVHIAPVNRPGGAVEEVAAEQRGLLRGHRKRSSGEDRPPLHHAVDEAQSVVAELVLRPVLVKTPVRLQPLAVARRDRQFFKNHVAAAFDHPGVAVDHALERVDRREPDPVLAGHPRLGAFEQRPGPRDQLRRGLVAEHDQGGGDGLRDADLHRPPVGIFEVVFDPEFECAAGGGGDFGLARQSAAGRIGVRERQQPGAGQMALGRPAAELGVLIIEVAPGAVGADFPEILLGFVDVALASGVKGRQLPP